jgi:hypothetical protein
VRAGKAPSQRAGPAPPVREDQAPSRREDPALSEPEDSEPSPREPRVPSRRDDRVPSVRGSRAPAVREKWPLAEDDDEWLDDEGDWSRAASSELLARRRRWMRAVAVIACFAVGLGLMAGGGWLLYKELARHATHAEQAAAGQAEIATRWERLTAGQVFPASIAYLTQAGLKADAVRVGIAPRASCSAALAPVAASALNKQGCSTVLRATYTDPSGTFVLTSGVAVMPSAAAARRAVTNFGNQHPTGGLKPVTFQGTVADVALTPHGEWVGVFHAGPYVVLFVGGYTDGQAVTGSTVNPGLAAMAFGVSRALVVDLAQGPPPCQRGDIQC